MTGFSPQSRAYTVATYRLQDIAKARAERDRLREECWDAFMKRAGDVVYVLINPPS